MTSSITRFEAELLARARVFLEAAQDEAEARAYMEKFGFVAAERERGHQLVRNVERAFEWERTGKAWNFLSGSVEGRLAEARAWHREALRRQVRTCLRTGAIKELLRLVSPRWLGAQRAELRRNLACARGEKPLDAPPPKDSALVELSGWYEHWRLLAQRVFRLRPDLLSPFGLVPGKAPPRLRSRSARLRYGEGAASPRETPEAGVDAAEEKPVGETISGRALRVLD